MQPLTPKPMRGGGGKQQVTIPVTAQTANNAPTEYLPVFAGSHYSIEASFTATAKKTTLSKILKAAGLATATYQTTQNIAWGKGQLKTANPNWLIPVGLSVALGADKLLPHKKATAYIRYTLYNTDTTIQQVYIEPVSGNKKPVVFNGTVPANGFLTVAFLNTKLIPVTGGNITVSIQQFTDDDNLPIVRKVLDTQLLLPEKKALALPQIEPVPPVLPALYAVAESTAVIVNPITKEGNNNNKYNPPAPTPLKAQSSINKTLHLPNPLPQPVVPETPTIPLLGFLWEALPPKRFILNEEEPEPEPIEGGEDDALFDDSYSIHSGWGPPLPDVTVVSPPSPQPPPPDPSYPSYDDGGGGDGGDEDGDGGSSSGGNSQPNPCSIDPKSLECYCKDNPNDEKCYCLIHPEDEKCCNTSDPNSDCYDPCEADPTIDGCCDPSDPTGGCYCDPDIDPNCNPCPVPNYSSQLNTQDATKAPDGNSWYDEYDSEDDQLDPDTLNDILSSIALDEGGDFENNAYDSGGPTKWGIDWQDWQNNAQRILGIEPSLLNLQNLTQQQAEEIYEQEYYYGNNLNSLWNGRIAGAILNQNLQSGRQALVNTIKALNSLGYNFPISGSGNPLSQGVINALNAVNANDFLSAFKNSMQQSLYSVFNKQHLYKCNKGKLTKQNDPCQNIQGSINRVNRL
ncbi:MAG: hypothetical protein JSR11_03305 [Bacteroidetes bacterium]|nr:hypothetical protein [Bacteroidota bacterium]